MINRHLRVFVSSRMEELAAVRDVLKDEADTIPLDNLSAMDAPENMNALQQLGTAAGKINVNGKQFPPVFDLT